MMAQGECNIFFYSTATIYMWYMYVMYVCEAQGDTYMWAGWLMMAQDVTQSAIFNSILFYSIVNSSATIYMIYVCDVCMWSTGWYIYTYICTYMYAQGDTSICELDD